MRWPINLDSLHFQIARLFEQFIELFGLLLRLFALRVLDMGP